MWDEHTRSVHKIRFHLLFTNQWESSCLTWLLNEWMDQVIFVYSCFSLGYLCFETILCIELRFCKVIRDCKHFFFTSHQNITSLCQVKSQISTRRKFSTLVPCLPLPALFSKWNESLWWVSSRFGASPNSSSIIHLFSIFSQVMRSDSMSNSSSTVSKKNILPFSHNHDTIIITRTQNCSLLHVSW